MLILDLDDTIFETKSMDPNIFEPAISIIENYYYKNDHSHQLEEITRDLWSKPIDNVFEKYATPDFIQREFFEVLDNLDYLKLNIKPFEDYQILNQIKKPKVLVTTGLKKLQSAKIKALNIRKDFECVYIDDPRLKPRNTKIVLFKLILSSYKLNPRDCWVIGDNPDSEILAGHALGMKTIQRNSSSKKPSLIADYKIDSFKELEKIIY